MGPMEVGRLFYELSAFVIVLIILVVIFLVRGTRWIPTREESENLPIYLLLLAGVFLPVVIFLVFL
jgi:hypothetical protein